MVVAAVASTQVVAVDLVIQVDTSNTTMAYPILDKPFILPLQLQYHLLHQDGMLFKSENLF